MQNNSNPQMMRIVTAALAAVMLVANVLIVNALHDDVPDIPAVKEPAYTLDDILSDSSLSPTDTAVSASDLSASDIDSEPELVEYDIPYPYFITIDKIGQVVSIYTTNEEGKYETLVRQCICSTGESVDKLPDGYYKLKNSKYKWQTMLSHGDPLYAQYTTRITGSFLFHSVPYTATKKDALDTKRYKNLGKANSGGCIRLTVECAKWIYDNCVAGTTVYVFKGKYDAELIESLRPPTPTSSWDPTDPDPANPNYQPQYDESTEPKPYVYAPLYDYDWEYAPEVPRIFYTSTTAATTTVATESTTVPTDNAGDTGSSDTSASATASTAATTAAPTAAPTTTTTTTAAPTTTTTTAAPATDNSGSEGGQ